VTHDLLQCLKLNKKNKLTQLSQWQPQNDELFKFDCISGARGDTSHVTAVLGDTGRKHEITRAVR